MNDVHDFIIAHSHLLLFAFYGIGCCRKSKSQGVFALVLLCALMAGPLEYWLAPYMKADMDVLSAIKGALSHSFSVVDFSAITDAMIQGFSLGLTELFLLGCSPTVALIAICED